MYTTLLTFHSIFRWLLLIALILSIYIGIRGYFSGKKFSKADNHIRHWTATISHIQLLLGIIIYTQSPIISYFWKNTATAIQHIDNLFFGLIHSVLMLVSIVLITIGSAKAKRQTTDQSKYKTMLIWFTIALIIIFIAIPWPFSPLANRPYIRL